MAHVGVLEILDSLGVVPDIVVGTSMGSIVGGMYASGYSGAEIERLTQRYNIGAYIGRYAPRAPREFAISGVANASLFGSELPGEPAPLVLLHGGRGGFTFATSFADQGVVNLLLSALMLRGDLMARGNFDSLPIPFRAVATDAHTGERVVLDRGDLAKAIRASVAIPLVFDPVTRAGRQLVDGGLSENVPVRLARELGATRIILSTLDGTGAVPDTTMAGPVGGVIDMMMNRIFLDAHPPLGRDDVEVRTDVSDISNLDFSASTVGRLIQRGSAAARTIPASSCLPRRRRVTRPLPPVSSTPVTADAAPGAAALLRSAVAPTEPLLPGWLRWPSTKRRTTISSIRFGADSAAVFLDTVQARLARLGTSGLVNALWLSPQPAAGDSVAFDPDIRWPERRTVGMGAAFDNDLGGQAWLAIARRQLVLNNALPRLDGGGRLTLGSRRQEGFISVRRSTSDVRYSASPFAMLLLSRESAPLFIQVPHGTAIKVELPIMSEQLVQVGEDVPVAPSWYVQAGGLVRRWKGGLESSTRTPIALGLALRVDHTDDTGGPLTRVDVEWNDHYRRGSARIAKTTMTRFAQLSSIARVGATTADAPYSARFLLGGTEGFAGLNVGESIGAWMASYMLDAARPLSGPLSIQLTGMTGTVSESTDRAFGGVWLLGVRAGVGADSPLGPVRLQYGLASNGRRQWFARVGRWI